MSTSRGHQIMPQFCEASTLSQPGATSWGGVGILVHRLRPQWHDHKLHLLFLSAMARSLDSIHHELSYVPSIFLATPRPSPQLWITPTAFTGATARSNNQHLHRSLEIYISLYLYSSNIIHMLHII